ISFMVARAAVAAPSVENYPLGTIFVAHHGRDVVFATEREFWIRRQGKPPVMSPEIGAPRNAVFSPDGKKIILNYYSSSLVVSALDLHILKHRHAIAWWEGNGMGWLDYEDYLFTGGRRHPINIGRTDFLAVDESGAYFLGLRPIKTGNAEEDISNPKSYMQLWKRGKDGRLRYAYKMETAIFDRFEGDPTHLAVLGDRLAVYGYPAGGGVGYDYIDVWRRGRSADTVKDSAGDNLIFREQGSFVTPNAIIGLAETLVTADRHPTRYFYRVTDSGMTLTPVADNVVLVTYDPARGIGLGVQGKDVVTVTYHP
ncbi:MAG: hypothetical protein ABIY70_04275, partial [Capsulimonas sp.]|uniref:hypothetical protein n=1 Tax=Capsulimonas sp. TaxID=2494211 RepID=UPI0032635BAD